MSNLTKTYNDWLLCLKFWFFQRWPGSIGYLLQYHLPYPWNSFNNAHRKYGLSFFIVLSLKFMKQNVTATCKKCDTHHIPWSIEVPKIPHSGKWILHMKRLIISPSQHIPSSLCKSEQNNSLYIKGSFNRIQSFKLY